MSAAAAMNVEEIAMGLPYTNIWTRSEAQRLEYLQDFYLVIKMCMLNGISGWLPKRVYVILPKSDDRLCTEMSRAALSNKPCTIDSVSMTIGENIGCSKGAKTRVKEIAQLRAETKMKILPLDERSLSRKPNGHRPDRAGKFARQRVQFQIGQRLTPQCSLRSRTSLKAKVSAQEKALKG